MSKLNNETEKYFPCLYDDRICRMTWVVGQAMTLDKAFAHLKRHHLSARLAIEAAPMPVSVLGLKCRIRRDDRGLRTDALAVRLNKLLPS